MGSRKYINIGLLACGLLLTQLGSAVITSAQQGATYVHVAADKGSGTILELELDGITPPAQAQLIVTRESDNQIVVDQQVNISKDSKYYWSGILTPLGRYRAQLFDVNRRSVALGLPYAFNNNDILKEFIEGERGEIIHLTRGGNEPTDPQTELKRLSVSNLLRSNGKNKVHIVVINKYNTNADEYFGPLPSNQVWESKLLPLGDYRVFIFEYNENQTCTLIRRT